MTPEEIREWALDTIQEWFPRYPDGFCRAVVTVRTDECVTIQVQDPGDGKTFFCVRVTVEEL